ncbi:MAG: carbohydrate kinase family protein [bacterium]
MHMYDVICVGTTTIDMYYRGGDLTLKNGSFDLVHGNKYFADFFHESVGGGATNVAIGLAKLGLHPTLASEIGQNPFKRVIYEKLDLSGVSYKHCYLSESYQNFSTILLCDKGEKTVINYRSPQSHFHRHTLPDELFIHSRALYLGHIAQLATHYRVQLLKLARAHKLPTFVTMGADDLAGEYQSVAQIMKETDVLIVNKTEIATYVQVSPDSLDLQDNLHLAFPNLMLPPLLIVTDGAHGVYAHARDHVTHQPAVHMEKIVDMTGAGDGFCAGFIAAYIKDAHLQAALKNGVEFAAKKIGHLGAN